MEHGKRNVDFPSSTANKKTNRIMYLPLSWQESLDIAVKTKECAWLGLCSCKVVREQLLQRARETLSAELIFSNGFHQLTGAPTPCCVFAYGCSSYWMQNRQQQNSRPKSASAAENCTLRGLWQYLLCLLDMLAWAQCHDSSLTTLCFSSKTHLSTWDMVV